MKSYIFRGAPSSGKTTLTKEFLKDIPGKVAYLELDNFRWGFHLINREVKDITEDEHRLAYKNFLSVLENYCENGEYTLVIEGLFSWENHGAHGNMEDIIRILDKYDVDCKVFFLTSEYETLWKRNNQREYIVPKKEFNDLFNYVGKPNPSREKVIDVGEKSLEECIEILRA